MDATMPVTRRQVDLPRAALLLDAYTVAPFALIVIAGAQPIAEFLGWDEPLVLVGLGLVFLPYAAMLWLDARRPRFTRRMLWVPIGLNSAWIAASATILATGSPALTTGGSWAVGVVAALVAGIAAVQAVALRRVPS